MKIDEVSDVLELRGFNLARGKGLLDKVSLRFIDLLILSIIISSISLITYFSLTGVLNPLNSSIYRILVSYSGVSGCPV
jgi:hypothetical protein